MTATDLLMNTREPLLWLHARSHSVRDTDEPVDPLLAAHLVREVMNGLARCTLKEDHRSGRNMLESIHKEWDSLLADILRPLLADDKLWNEPDERRERLQARVDKMVQLVADSKYESDSGKRNVARALTRIIGRRVPEDHAWVEKWRRLSRKGRGGAHYRGPSEDIIPKEEAMRLVEAMDFFLNELAASPTDELDRVDELLEEFDA